MLTIEQAITLGKLYTSNTYSTDKYYITGIITEVYQTTFGNLYITDGKNTFTIYGTYNEDGTIRYDQMTTKPVAGDLITIYGSVGQYNGSAQVKNGWMTDLCKHAYEETSRTEATCSTEGSITYVCIDCNHTKVDSIPTTEHTYENHKCTVCGKGETVIENVATFDFGANGSAAHVDGNAYSGSKTYTNNGYSLVLSSLTSVYGPAYDAKGNSCIKLGTSSKTGSFSFTVPEDVTKVVIYVAKYKSNTTKVTVNGTTYTISGASNNGAYDAIEVDTTTTKTVSFATVSGACRAMINTIEFYAEKDFSAGACEHNYEETARVDATCTSYGSVTLTCAPCGDEKIETLDIIAHNYVDGKCSVCELPQPDSTLTIPEANALGAKQEGYTSGKYYVTGVISEIKDTAWGNLYIKDAEGNTLYIYGLYSADGKTRYDAMTTKPVVGDTITVYGVVGQYNKSPQIQSGWMTAYTPAAPEGGDDVCEHNYTETKVDATCTTEGSITKVCTLCGDTQTETIPVVKHNYVDGKCSVCEAIDPDYVAPDQPDTPAVTEKTESTNIIATEGTLVGTEISWTTDSFIIVGAKGGSTSDIRVSDSDHFRLYAKSILAIEGTEGQTIVKVVITCTSSDYATVLTTSATNAGYTTTADGSVVTITVNGPTLEITASAQVRLNNIEITYTVAAGACDHKYVETSNTAATCTEAGSIIFTCESCGKEKTETIPVIAHTYGEWAETTAPTCTEAGEKTQSCTCGDVKTEVVPALGHTTDNGTCERCNEVIGGTTEPDAPAEPTIVLEITKADFNSTSYAANNNTKTKNGYKYTSYQVMNQNSTMQWQKSKGYITISNDNFVKLEIKVTAGTFTVTVGGTKISGTTSNGVTTYDLSNLTGEIKISVGSATGKVDYINFYK